MAEKWREEYEERAAIFEYDGGFCRESAEIEADTEIYGRMLEGRLK